MRKLLLVALAACTRNVELPPEQAATAKSASPAASTAPVASAAETPAVEAPLAWGTRPATTGRLFPVVDGMCIHLETWALADGVAVTWGNGQGGAFVRANWDEKQGETFAVLEPDGHPRLLPANQLDTINAGGRVDALWQIDTVGNPRMGHTDAVLRVRTGDTWTDRTKVRLSEGDTVGGQTEAIEPRYAGPPMFLRSLSAKDGGAALVALDGSVTRPKWLAGWTTATAVRLENGAYVALGHAGELYDTEAATMRFGAPDGSSKPLTVPKDTTLRAAGKVAWAWSSKRVYAIGDDGSTTDFATPPGILRFVPLLTGDAYLFATDGSVYRATKTAATKVGALPEALSGKVETRSVGFLPGGGNVVDADEKGHAWAIGKSGALYESADGSSWTLVPFPTAPFASVPYQAERVLVRAPDDVLVNARYIEKGLGWKTPEPYRALLRTKRPAETMRCADAIWDSDVGHGFKSWPPHADDACTTPFVVLFQNNMAFRYKTGGDYKGLAKSLKPFTAKVTEFKVAGVTYAGTKVESVAKGRELATSLPKGANNLLRPELVCGTPPDVIREVDLP